MMLPRRAVLLTGALGSSWFQASTPAMMTMTLDDWADWICAYTPPSFRHAVQESNHFLYRGAEDNNGILQHPASDLLVEGTYDDPAALQYFRCLEQRLDQASVRARPSNGHVATSDPNEAGQWGPVVSVWPLGTEWSYVWPKDQTTLFVDSGNPYTCRGDRLVIDTNLPNALTQPREVLFASWFSENASSLPPTISKSWTSAFLTIPLENDETLRRKLQERSYGL
jgi:hypothetical protein